MNPSDEFTFSCSDCNQRITAPESMRGQTVNCPNCSERIFIPLAALPKATTPALKMTPAASPQQAKPQEIMTNVKQGAIIGGWACFGLGIVCMFLSLFTFFLYVPFFFVSFVLSIVAMSQRRVAQGIMLLLATLIVPTILGIALAATRTVKLAEELRETKAEPIVANPISVPEKSNQPEANPPGDLATSTQAPTLLDKLDEKNGFQEFKLGSPLSQFSGLKPATRVLDTNRDEKNFSVENFNPRLGDFEISDIFLSFEMDLLKEISVRSTGKQNITGLKETLIQAYGQPESSSFMGEDFVWEGKRVELRFSKSLIEESASARFTSKEVESKIKTETERKAKEGAAAASKEL